MKNEELALAVERSKWMHVVPDPVRYANEKLKYVEPVVHEICHAISFGMNVDPEAPEKVSSYFKELNSRSRGIALVYEAHAFAIENRVLRQLGWRPHFDLNALMKDIWETGYSGPAVPFKTYLSIYRAFSQETCTKVHAERVIDSLYAIAKMPVPKEKARATLRG